MLQPGVTRALARHVEVNSRRSTFYSGPLDLRAQDQVASVLWSDTPPSAIAASERLSPSACERARSAGMKNLAITSPGASRRVKTGSCTERR